MENILDLDECDIYEKGDTRKEIWEIDYGWDGGKGFIYYRLYKSKTVYNWGLRKECPQWEFVRHVKCSFNTFKRWAKSARNISKTALEQDTLNET